ncbi:TPA: allantoate deiminase [Klebsiella oxytoca]|uniref:allantoate deiminase n=1 Tax=Klebsiella oxytoca TaxID=571 RepID=UPI000CFE97E2|nr:allantoate deiminase [Klebsiella oxytoca]AVL81376.1 allantoate amidohydrolase [Klebsiella oxytoca]EKX5080388.1 allantoate deiminase [Klebsiella oxytoca]EKX5097358.1 allantoate deiminase [Klebsiella oxytoca]ELQ8985943.1 allantoate deiminase [Klebsiella oxytoca]NDR42339.1 allantoate deiminase [Klebsiella oxytoca]
MAHYFRQAIEETLPWLSSFGADPTGGITRLLYSPEWLQAQQAFKQRMSESGLETRFDEVGNLYGRLPGTRFPDEVILSGSHIDSVVNGGNLDGQFGALAAWLAVRWLKETYGAPLRTVEVLALAEEEGSRFPYVFWGSKNIVGIANPADVREIKDAKGVAFIDAMKQCGFSLPGAPLAPRRDIKAFVELHIEQGRVLETNKHSIGVVNAIVGQRRYTITLTGESNHAGTTPMGYRRDTVHAFSRICCESIAKAKAHGDPLVLTFGKVDPQPNTVNVVPGKTVFTMDCRHTDALELTAFTEVIEADMRRICQEMDIGIEIDLWMDEAPVPMDKKLVAQLTALCEKEKVNFRVMHSGAGHDAQIFAPCFPTCMIFMPSIKGISHNPAESTHIEDLAEGVKTLALMLHQLAWTE